MNFASQMNSEFRLVKIDKLSELTFELSLSKTNPVKNSLKFSPSLQLSEGNFG